MPATIIMIMTTMIMMIMIMMLLSLFFTVCGPKYTFLCNFRRKTSESALAAAAAPDDCCEIYQLAPREGFSLVPRGHARFCESCALRAADRCWNS